jgi:hypothetical protein
VSSEQLVGRASMPTNKEGMVKDGFGFAVLTKNQKRKTKNHMVGEAHPALKAES